MQQVIITSINIEGFASYALPTEFKFDKFGLFCVAGGNGVGKSTLFTALYWCLYKKTQKDWTNNAIQTFSWMRPATYKGTRVVVQLTVGKTKYLIARHLNYKGKTIGVVGENKLIIYTKPADSKEKWADSHMLGEALYKGDQQQFINKLLGINAEAFINSIIFGQRMNRLIGASPKDKRELFENLFELYFVETAKEKAEAASKEISAEIAALNQEMVLLEKDSLALSTSLQDKRDIINTFQDQKTRRLKGIKLELNASITKYNDLIAKIETLEEEQAKPKKKAKTITPEKLEELFKAADSLKEQLTEGQANLKVLQRDVRDIEKEITRVARAIQTRKDSHDNQRTECYTCGNTIKPEKIAEIKKGLLQEIKELQKELKELEANKEVKLSDIRWQENTNEQASKDFNVAMTAWEDGKARQINNDDKIQQDINRSIDLLEIIEEGIKASKKRYKEEKETVSPVVETEQLEKKIADIDIAVGGIVADITRKERTLEHYNFWWKKGFGNNGIKSYVFSAMLQQLNEYVAEYAAYFGYGVKFWIDLQKESKPFVTTIYRGDKEYDYDSLSGGQAQRVDIAMAFAMFDLVSYKTGFNIVVLDELFEGVSIEGVEMVNDIIKMKAENKAIYLISHNPIFIPSNAQTITITGGVDSPSTIGYY